MKLINSETGNEVKVGDAVTTFRDEDGTVTDVEEPRKPSSTGRVYVKFTYPNASLTKEFFPSVIGAEWVEREDR
jgi:hypothetical protein